MLVSRSSLAYWMVTALRNVLDGEYAADSGPVVFSEAAVVWRVREPTVLDMLTIRGDAERRRRRSSAVLTRITRITFGPPAAGTAARLTAVACCGMPPVTP